jgi:uncharacterized protein
VKVLRKAFILFVVAFAAAAVPLLALDVPPPPAQWFTDTAHLVGPTEADLLNTKLSNFEQSSGAQFIIYTFPSLEGESLEDFTIRCVERWKVGQKKYDNGLVLFVFAKERKARVEVGYGLEGAVPDAIASRAIREQLAPAFQAGDYGRGLNAAADALMARIKGGEAPVAPLQPRGSGASQGAQGDGELSVTMIVFVLFIVFFVIVPMFTRGRRRGRGGCGGCILPFFMPGGITLGGGRGGGGFGGFGGGGGGFSGGGGGFGGGGASGGW